ncbi:putative M18 family aminopeptidase 2 OS=Streptomyces antimycoticus OX=68175 GN=apeB PE=3 SV=1 [Streptomyces antimycoticus]
MSAQPGIDRGHTDDLMSFLRASPSPYHAVASAAERLEKAGFQRIGDGVLGRRGRWSVRAAGRCDHCVVRTGGGGPRHSVPNCRCSYRLSHLRVKPIPDTGAHGWRQIAVEVYGGVLLNTWLDRDLGLSGPISSRDGYTISSPSTGRC